MSCSICEVSHEIEEMEEMKAMEEMEEAEESVEIEEYMNKMFMICEEGGSRKIISRRRKHEATKLDLD